jgi:hypothetical protein
MSLDERQQVPELAHAHEVIAARNSATSLLA